MRAAARLRLGAAVCVLGGTWLVPIATRAAAPPLVGADAGGPAVHTYVVAIGNNDPPEETHGGARADRLPVLRFADDDAAAFYSFTRPFATYAALLTVPDADSQRRFPEALAEARPPTLADLRVVVGQIARRLAADQLAGIETTVLFFYSGHGSAGEHGPAFLTMLDGGLTREVLYRDVLGALPARYVHVFIDACHAEAVVRPRDLAAKAIDLTAEDVTAYAERATLARFPNVGAVVAASSTAVAHEWDTYQGGVFTHEILSALRGSADINGDDRVEYSELSAFIAAANREVADPRARLRAVVVPPRVNPRAPLIDLGRLPEAGRIYGRPASLGAVYIEDLSGQRLADLRAEPGFLVRLAVPADRTLFVRRGAEEAEIRLRPGQALAFDQLEFRPLGNRNRDAITSALRDGLFATPFGPVYYRGFTDGNADIVSIPFATMDATAERDELGTDAGAGAGARRTRSSRAATILFVGAGALAAAGGVFGALTYDAYNDFQRTDLQNAADDANRRFRVYGLTSAALLSSAVAAAAVGTYLRWRDPAPEDRRQDLRDR